MIPFLEPQRELRPTTFAEPSENVSFGERLTSLRKYLPENIAAELGSNPQAVRDLFMPAERQTMLVDTLVSSNIATEQAYDRRIKAVKDATGIELPNPLRGGFQQEVTRAARARRDASLTQVDEDLPDVVTGGQLFEQRLAELRDKHPDKLDALTFGDVRKEAEAIAKGSDADYEEAKRTTPLTPGAALATEFAGAMYGQRRDPLFVGSMFLGPTSAVGKTVAARIATSSLFQGFYNAGISALEQPAVQQWRSEIGVKSGVQPAIENVGMAFLFGAIPGAALRGLHELGAAERAAVQRVTAGTPETGDIEKVMQIARSALAEIDAGEKVKRPAVRVEGNIYEDLNHGMAVDRAEAELGRPPTLEEIESGFTTTQGRFVDRDEAARLANKAADLQSSDLPYQAAKLGEEMDDAAKITTPRQPKDVSPELHDDLVTAAQRYADDPINQPSPEGVAAAAKINYEPAVQIDGKVYRGINHSDAMERAARDLGLTEDEMLARLERGDNDGFVNSEGEFVSRAEASKQLAQQEIRDRIAAARPETLHDAQMAASEALEDIGNRDTIARTRAQMENDKLPTFTLDETFDQPVGSKDDPLGMIPIADKKGNADMVSPRTIARAGERELKLVDLIRECK